MFLCAMEKTLQRLQTNSRILLVLHHACVVVLDKRVAHLLDMLDDRDTIRFLFLFLFFFPHRGIRGDKRAEYGQCEKNWKGIDGQ